MDIEEAVVRANELELKIKKAQIIIEAAQEKYINDRYVNKPKVYLCMNNYDSLDLVINQDEAISMLNKTKETAESELAKLQPVIDTANAALKGIGV